MHKEELFMLLLTALSVQACNSVYDFDYSSCQFHVDYGNDTTCSRFTFVKCRWQACIRSYRDSNNNEQCQEYKWFQDVDWQKCTEKCCDSNVNYSKTYSALQECQDYLKSSFVRAVIIAVSIGLFFVMIITICCCACCRCFSDCCGKIANFCQFLLCCPCFRRHRPPPPPQQPQRQPSSMIQFQICGQFHPNWKFQSIRNLKLDNVCSICLESQPSLQLSCGHIYHRECILQWIKKKEQCTLCRSNDFRTAQVYCQKCFASSYDVQFSRQAGRLSSSKQICDGCQEAGLDESWAKDNVNQK